MSGRARGRHAQRALGPSLCRGGAGGRGSARAFFSGVYGYPVGAQFPPSWVAGSSFITRESDAVFEDDMVFHLPICLRKPGEWGMGFSETIRVTRAGAECITANDRALHEVD